MTATDANDDDRYLWDRSGPPDEHVVALERLLGPWRAVPRPRLAPAPPPRRRALAWAPFAAAAAAVVLALGGVAMRRDAPGLHVSDDAGQALPRGTWVEAGAVPREVVLAGVGTVTVRPGARVQVREVGRELARLYLDRGAIEARIGADARPRLFQVDTRAGRCVDLGCRYVLTATDDGGAHVRVTTGRVSFEAGPREVYVPAGAEVTARPGRGPGTPRFVGAGPSLVDALDTFDAGRSGDAGRLAAARRAAANVASREDLLPLWHWLTDDDADVARVALDALVAHAGRPVGWSPPPGRPGPADRTAFLAHLDDAW